MTPEARHFQIMVFSVDLIDYCTDCPEVRDAIVADLVTIGPITTSNDHEEN